MQEESQVGSKKQEEKTQNLCGKADLKEELRKDYTNLQGVYWAKLAVLITVALIVIVQSWYDVRGLLVAACTFAATILFDIIVVKLSNKGPKTKHKNWCIALLVLVIIVLIGTLVLLISDYIPTGLLANVISWCLRILMIFLGICGPCTELVFNKPNND